MVLPATTQMLTSRDIKVLHLESTDVCQASCPQCAREIDPDFNPEVKNYLTVDILDEILPKKFVAGLHKMFMCGNYGDPAANHQTLSIYHWFRKINPSIVLGMNTNGGLQNSNWWDDLAKIMCQSYDYVVFSIDGLEDTNGNYRVNVNWDKVMQNAEAFIAAGGIAHWDMLIYRHNEHQVDACEQLARKMGFKWFRAKVSKRALVGQLEFPINWQPPQFRTSKINCHALSEQSIYIDAQGRVSPCCWLGGRQKDFITDFEKIKKSWDSRNPNVVCVNACGSEHIETNFSTQWRKEIAL